MIQVSQKMKWGIIVVLLLSTVVGVVQSCNSDQKKEAQEWKKKAGSYVRDESFTIYEDAKWFLAFDRVNVDGSGISLISQTHKKCPAINFDVLQKSKNNHPKYEYKLRYSSLLSIYISEDDTVTNPQINHELFIHNREFYLSFRDNVLIFTIIDRGEIINLEFTKQ